MNIAFFSASPRAKGRSTSERLLSGIAERLPADAAHDIFFMNTQNVSDALRDAFFAADAAVIAFPLYVDGVPSHLLRCMEQLEQLREGRDRLPVLYAVCNNGFFEPEQCRCAVGIMRFWARRCGMTFGGALVVGGGGGIAEMPAFAFGTGPLTYIGTAMDKAAESIAAAGTFEDIYTKVAFPRRLYIMGAHSGWRKAARANGLRVRDLKKRL